MKIPLVFFLVVMAKGFSLSSAGQSCERITNQICKGLGYNYTLFPNRFNHSTQNEASLEMHQFYPLLRTGCSSSLRKFLCSMYVPVCSKTPLPPCRSLCKHAKSGCAQVMRTFGMPWPKTFECSNFPDFGDQLCISSTEDQSAPKIPRIEPSATAAPTTTTTTTLSTTSPTTTAPAPTTTPKASRTQPSTTAAPITTAPSSTTRKPTTTQAVTATSGEVKNGHVCERITIPMCKGISYNYTRMPNILNHNSQSEATIEVHQYWPLVRAGCSSSFRKFLCSVYAPRCTATGGTMLPCRSLCEESKSGCEPLMKQYGFAWPTNLNCGRFPVEGGDTSCIAPDPQPRRVCQKITVPMCKGIGYNYTRMPNILNHNTQAEATLQVQKFWPLIQVGCSSSFRKFLCSVYAPRCTATGGTMLPCRSLCEESKRGCESLMRKYDFAWPTSLNCSSFPVEGDDRSCIAPDARPASEATGTTTKIPPSTTTLGRVEAARASKCEKITIPLCKGLSYNYTMYPNRLGHRTQDEAGLEVHQFFPLVKVDCSSSFSLLLCTVYAPKCSDTLIPPCRSLCERSRKGCQKLTVTFGFSWPASLNCSLFPVEGGTTKCIPPETDITTTARPTVATVTLPPKKYRTVLTKIKGVFTSPNYPNPYPQGIESNWIIQLPDWYKAVKITIRNMRLEEDRNCLYDYILIKDKMLNQVGPRHCGTYRNPYQVLVRGDKAIITFVSDGSTSKAGFVIKYKGLLDYS